MHGVQASEEVYLGLNQPLSCLQPHCATTLVTASLLHPDGHDVSEHLQCHEHTGSLDQHQYGRSSCNATCLTVEPGTEPCHAATQVHHGAGCHITQVQGPKATLGIDKGAILPGIQAAGGWDAARLHSGGTAVEVPARMDKESCGLHTHIPSAGTSPPPTSPAAQLTG